MATAPRAPSAQRTSLRQKLVLVLLGLAVGVATVIALELALRVTGIGAGETRYDPFAGFSRTVPMFEPATRDDGTQVFRTAKARRVRWPQEFLAVKPANGFRVFVVGESSRYAPTIARAPSRESQTATPRVSPVRPSGATRAASSVQVVAVLRKTRALPESGPPAESSNGTPTSIRVAEPSTVSWTPS